MNSTTGLESRWFWILSFMSIEVFSCRWRPIAGSYRVKRTGRSPLKQRRSTLGFSSIIAQAWGNKTSDSRPQATAVLKSENIHGLIYTRFLHNLVDRICARMDGDSQLAP